MFCCLRVCMCVCGKHEEMRSWLLYIPAITAPTAHSTLAAGADRVLYCTSRLQWDFLQMFIL